MKPFMVTSLVIILVLTLVMLIINLVSTRNNEGYAASKSCFNRRSKTWEFVDTTDRASTCQSAGCQYTDGAMSDKEVGGNGITCCNIRAKTNDLVHTNGLSCDCFDPNYTSKGPWCTTDVDKIQLEIAQNARSHMKCYDNPLQYPECGGTKPPHELTQTLVWQEGDASDRAELNYKIWPTEYKPNFKLSANLTFYAVLNSRWFAVTYGDITLRDVQLTQPVRVLTELLNLKFTVDDPFYPTELYLQGAPVSFGNVLKLTWNNGISSITITNPKTNQTWTLPYDGQSPNLPPFRPKIIPTDPPITDAPLPTTAPTTAAPTKPPKTAFGCMKDSDCTGGKKCKSIGSFKRYCA